MVERKNKWGVPFFVFGLVLLAIGYWLLEWLPLRLDIGFIKKLFFYTGVTGGAVAPILGYFSYPRIHNLKVFLAGWLTGLVILAFFLLRSSWLFSFPVPSDFIPGLYLTMIGAMFISIVVPAFLKYRWVKWITIVVLIAEAVVIYLLRTDTLKIISLHSLREFYTYRWSFFIPGIATFLSILFSVLFLRGQFYLGSVLAGMVLIFGGGWYLGPLSSQPLLFDSYCFAISPLFLILGVFIHWMARMEHRAFYDSLLWVYNRSYCEMILAEQARVNTAPPFGVAIVDIDHFKKLNDTYGHDFGDKVLSQVARVLKNELVPHGIVCRYGGEEFVVFFPGQSSAKVKAMMERIRKMVMALSLKKRVKITVSIGISERRSPAQSLFQVLKAADKALYQAKKQGRNQVRVGRAAL